MTVLNIAHRGGRPENTLEAFRTSIELGVDGVEMDVHLWNGELVVVHNPPVKRVRPSFREVLELLQPTPVQVFAECKAVPRFYPRIAELIVRTIEDYGMIDRCVFGSFDHYAVVAAKRANWKLRTAVLSSDRIYDPGRYVRQIGADIYAPSAEVIGLRSESGRPDPGSFLSCKQVNVDVWIHTVNDGEDMKKAIAAGAAAIFTDEPALLKGLARS